MTAMRYLVSVNSGHMEAHSDFRIEKDLASMIVDKIVNMRGNIVGFKKINVLPHNIVPHEILL